MTQITHVVLHDEERRFYPGALVTGEVAAMYKARGVVMIPVDSEKMRMNGASGYVLKSYGSGWVLNSVSPATLCPVVLFVGEGDSRINWVAQLKKERGAQASGFVRLVGDSGQMGSSGVSLGDSKLVDFSKLPVEEDKIVVGGTCSLSLTGNYFVGLSLYGKGQNVSVMWIAVSQTSR